MTEQVQVVDAEVSERNSSITPRSGWVLFALGCAVGIGTAVVFVAPIVQLPTATSTPGSVAPPLSSEDSETAEQGIGDVIEGFPDTLVALSRGNGSSLNHLLWPLSGPLLVTAVGDGGTVGFDSSGRFVSLTSVVPGLNGEVLSLGRYNQIRNVAAGVTGHAWHDSRPGILAYTSESEGTWRLSTVTANFQPTVVLESNTDLGRIAAWGDWGFALQSTPSQVSLLTNEGGLKDTEPGVVLASHHSGWLFMTDDTPKLVSAGGGVAAVNSDLAVGEPMIAAFSPDAAKLAVGGSMGVSILDVDTGEVEPVTEVATSSLVWSSDSRFLINGSGFGVSIFDDIEDDLQQVLRRQSVLTVSVIRLSGP